MQPPLPLLSKTRGLWKANAGTRQGQPRGAGRAPSTPLSSSEAAAAVSFPGSLTAPGPSPGWNTERGSSTAEPQPARYAAAVLPRTRPGFVTGLWGHRWDARQGSQQPENTAPVLLPLASQLLGREVFPVHRLREISITAEPFGKCSSERALKGLGVLESRVPSGDKYTKPSSRATWSLGPPLRSWEGDPRTIIREGSEDANLRASPDWRRAARYQTRHLPRSAT